MKYSNQQSGFSLVETLVAVTILLILIVTPMTTTIRSAKSATFSTEQVTAYFLAQEGAELAQLARNNLILDGGNWENFANDATGNFQYCFDPTGCRLEVDDTGGTVSVGICGSGGCRVYLDTSSSDRARFTHSSTGNLDTPYTRTINFERFGDEVSVRSEVTWRTGSLRQGQSVVVETYLFNLF